jgi:hypothetical protein
MPRSSFFWNVASITTSPSVLIEASTTPLEKVGCFSISDAVL